jgi:hypothetical protein
MLSLRLRLTWSQICVICTNICSIKWCASDAIDSWNGSIRIGHPLWRARLKWVLSSACLVMRLLRPRSFRRLLRLLKAQCATNLKPVSGPVPTQLSRRIRNEPQQSRIPRSTRLVTVSPECPGQLRLDAEISTHQNSQAVPPRLSWSYPRIFGMTQLAIPSWFPFSTILSPNHRSERNSCPERQRTAPWSKINRISFSASGLVHVQARGGLESGWRRERLAGTLASFSGWWGRGLGGYLPAEV